MGARCRLLCHTGVHHCRLRCAAGSTVDMAGGAPQQRNK